MPLRAHLMTAWVHQPRSNDHRTGFVVMDRGEFDLRAAAGDAQDPRVGALHLAPVKRPTPAPGPVFLGIALAITKELNPVVTLDRPITGIASGDSVLIMGSGWATLDDTWLPVTVLDADQLQLTGPDTTAEAGSAAGASVYGRPIAP